MGRILAPTGRPPKRPEDRQSERVNLSFTPAERAALESAADGKYPSGNKVYSS